jgi:hypothetical protein
MFRLNIFITVSASGPRGVDEALKLLIAALLFRED